MKSIKKKLLVGLILIAAGALLFVLIAAGALMSAELDEATNTYIIDGTFVALEIIPGGLIAGGIVCLTRPDPEQQKVRNAARAQAAETAAKRKRILNISHPSKFLISNDLTRFGGDPCCPLCSLYSHRIFSISGKDKRFPPLVSLPDEIHDGKCDVCHCYYYLSVWFEDVSNPDIVTAIQKSNAPLKDKRTPEQIKHFEEKKAKAERKAQKQKEKKEE